MFDSADLTDGQNLCSCGSISMKVVLIFQKNFLDFEYDWGNFGIYSSKIPASAILSNSEVISLGGREGFSLLFASLENGGLVYTDGISAEG